MTTDTKKPNNNKDGQRRIYRESLSRAVQTRWKQTGSGVFSEMSGNEDSEQEGNQGRNSQRSSRVLGDVVEEANDVLEEELMRAKTILNSHGKAVSFDVSPVWPAQPTCGVWPMQINRGIGAKPVEAFDNAKHAARHSFAVLLHPHNKPGLSACRLQTRLTKESRLCRD